jgi:hypothetical protein
MMVSNTAPGIGAAGAISTQRTDPWSQALRTSNDDCALAPTSELLSGGAGRAVSVCGGITISDHARATTFN